MKRGDLPRYTKLRNTTPLPRGSSELKRTELHRSAPIRRTPPPPLSGSSLSQSARKAGTRRAPIKRRRSPGPSPEEVAARRAVRQRSGGVCEVCGQAPAAEFQHRLPKSAQGPWDAANGLDVCGHGNYAGCHGHIHQNSIEAYARGWSVRRGHEFRSIPVDHARHGLVLLDSAGGVTPTTREAA